MTLRTRHFRLGAPTLAFALMSLLAAAPAAYPTADAADVAVDDAGNARFSFRQVVSPTQVVGERGLTGSTLGNRQFVSFSEQSVSGFPQIDAAPDGTATLVWDKTFPAPNAVQARRRFPDGSLGPVHTLATGVVSSTGVTDVAVDPGGNATFVWVKENSQGNTIVQTRTLRSDGSLTTAQAVSAAGQNAGNPDLAAAPNGDVIFAWTRSNGTHSIAQTRRRAAGGGFSAVQDLSAIGQNAFAARVAVDGDGDATFVWARSNGTHNIAQTRRRTAAGTLSAVNDLSAPGQSALNAAVAVDPDDDAAFAWHRSNGSNTVIQVRTRSGGGTLTGTQNISSAGQSASAAKVGMDAAGNATFAWNRSNGAEFIAQARRRSPTGTFGSTQNLSAAGADAFGVEMAVAPTGDAVFTWTRSFVVQGRRLGAGGGLGPILDVAG
jgi:hypothetical protein